MAIRIAHIIEGNSEMPVSATEPMSVHGVDCMVETLYAGCVVDVGEHNYYDDSDFFAIVYDAEKGTFSEYTYGSTRGWSYGNSAQVDASPELIEKYRAYVSAEYNKKALARAKKNIHVGATVTVVKGRKLAKGTVGTVAWYGPDKYRRNAYRAGVRFGKGSEMVFVDAGNLEVVV